MLAAARILLLPQALPRLAAQRTTLEAARAAASAVVAAAPVLRRYSSADAGARAATAGAAADAPAARQAHELDVAPAGEAPAPPHGHKRPKAGPAGVLPRLGHPVKRMEERVASRISGAGKGVRPPRGAPAHHAGEHQVANGLVDDGCRAMAVLLPHPLLSYATPLRRYPYPLPAPCAGGDTFCNPWPASYVERGLVDFFGKAVWDMKRLETYDLGEWWSWWRPWW